MYIFFSCKDHVNWQGLDKNVQALAERASVCKMTDSVTFFIAPSKGWPGQNVDVDADTDVVCGGVSMINRAFILFALLKELT